MKLLNLLFCATVVAAATTYHKPRADNDRFTYDNKSFYIDGNPIQLLGGQMDPQRIPRQYWKDRIEKAKAMGLNTVFSYIYWHFLEPSPGVFDWEGVDGANDIAAWYQALQDAGMYGVIRPGPYVCGERDWGGMPGWLTTISNSKSAITRTAAGREGLTEQ
jgi:beta-galactosidase GanA